MDDKHLLKQFSKPMEGEYIPITFVEFKRKLVGWSPEMKRSVYIEKEEEKEKLKRVREVNLMTAINHLSGKLSSIELTDEEKARFEEVYNMYLENGGQIMYTRKKTGGKTQSFFELREKWNKDTSPKGLLSERI